VAFLVVGGWMMGIIEEQHEDRLKREARRLKRRFLQKYPGVNSKFLCIKILV